MMELSQNEHKHNWITERQLNMIFPSGEVLQRFIDWSEEKDFLTTLAEGRQDDSFE